MIRARFAPSPTGLLHLGNAWAFLVAWLGARAAGGTLLLRLEDIDPDRSREEYGRSICEDFAWLGLDWDEGPDEGPCAPYRQSLRLDGYQVAIADLEDLGLVYPCYCTHKELRGLAGAPHLDDGGTPYPGTCRRLTWEQRAARETSGRHPSLRLFCPSDQVWSFSDRIFGEQRATLAECGGDFALRRSDGVVAYQLAVVVDDIAMRVNQVVRGADILPSTPRQLYLYSLLNAPGPAYAHVPLLLDHDGGRLAKRHRSLSLRALRESGVPPQVIVGALMYLAGLRERPERLTPREALTGFAFERIHPRPLRLPADPVLWLTALRQR